MTSCDRRLRDDVVGLAETEGAGVTALLVAGVESSLSEMVVAGVGTGEVELLPGMNEGMSRIPAAAERRVMGAILSQASQASQTRMVDW